MLLDMEKW